MQKHRLSKYEIAKRDRLRRVKNRSNKREWLLAGIATLLGTAAVVVVGSRMSTKSEYGNHLHLTSPDDSELSIAREAEREAFLETCLYFESLRQQGLSFTESLTVIQSGKQPVFSKGMMKHRGSKDEFETRSHTWFKIWCYIGGELNAEESKDIPGGCNGIDDIIRVGSLDIHRSDIENYIRSNYNQSQANNSFNQRR